MFLIHLVLGTIGFGVALRVPSRDAGDKGVIFDGPGAGLLVRRRSGCSSA
jgi:hypothetical protein